MKKVVPIISLICGLLLLYLGYDQYHTLPSEVDPFFGMSGQQQGIWMIIVGAAAAIAGFAGLFRDKLEDSGSDF